MRLVTPTTLPLLLKFCKEVIDRKNEVGLSVRVKTLKLVCLEDRVVPSDLHRKTFLELIEKSLNKKDLFEEYNSSRLGWIIGGYYDLLYAVIGQIFDGDYSNNVAVEEPKVTEMEVVPGKSLSVHSARNALQLSYDPSYRIEEHHAYATKLLGILRPFALLAIKQNKELKFIEYCDSLKGLFLIDLIWHYLKETVRFSDMPVKENLAMMHLMGGYGHPYFVDCWKEYAMFIEDHIALAIEAFKKGKEDDLIEAMKEGKKFIIEKTPKETLEALKNKYREQFGLPEGEDYALYEVPQITSGDLPKEISLTHEQLSKFYISFMDFLGDLRDEVASAGGENLEIFNVCTGALSSSSCSPDDRAKAITRLFELITMIEVGTQFAFWKRKNSGATPENFGEREGARLNARLIILQFFLNLYIGDHPVYDMREEPLRAKILSTYQSDNASAVNSTFNKEFEFIVQNFDKPISSLLSVVKFKQ